jgi:hypothetical protein
MPPRRRRASGGLTQEDVARLRQQLGEGRRPRVQLSGPQFEAGSSGAVVRIGDPDTDGADYLTVRVKVNGISDELAFAPAELSLGRTGAGQASAAGTASAARTTPTAGSAARRPGRTTARPKAAASSRPAEPAISVESGTSAESAISVEQAISVEPASSAVATQPAGPRGSAAASEPAPGPLTPATPTNRRRKAPAAPATVSVTISSTGASWSLSATRGAKAIAKNVPVAPGVVTAIAELLAQTGLVEAVADINETARQQAEQRADQLRAELSSLEAVLATHQAPR